MIITLNVGDLLLGLVVLVVAAVGFVPLILVLRHDAKQRRTAQLMARLQEEE